MSVGRAVAHTATATRMLLVESTRELGLILGFTVLFPVGLLFFLNLLVVPALRVQVLVGTIMMETALLNVNALAQTIGADKATKIFDLWVSLPISPVSYTLAVALSYLPYTLLAAVLTMGVAATVFHVALSVVVIAELTGGLLLVWGSTLGIGFLIGVLGRSSREINSWAQLIGILLTFFVPVFYPVSALPPALRAVAEVWPLTWGSRFLVAIASGSAATVAVSGAVLAAFVVLWAGLIGAGLRWRAR